MVNKNFLRHQKHSAGRGEPLHVEVTVGLAELHQVDAGQVAGRVIQKHVLRARIAGVDSPRVGAGVPVVDGGVVLHAGITALPGALGHAVHHLTGLVRRSGLRWVGNPASGPGVVAIDRRHEIVGESNREIGVLEQDRTVGLAVEVRVVAPLLNQDPRLLLFLTLALDELHDVGVVNLQRLHLGSATGLATALHHSRHLIVDPHEGEGAGRLAATGELLSLAAERGEIGAGARAELEEHGLAAGEIHDVFHVVLDALNEAGAALWIFVGVVGHHHVVLRLVPPPVARCSLHAVLVIEPDVEPDR